MTTSSKKILFILASKAFRDSEYFITYEILKKAGHQIFVASDIKADGIALGADGGEVPINYNLTEVYPGDFDLIVFIGGPGALKHLDNEESYKIALAAVEKGKKLAAICIAPIILAKAGVLKNKKATVWSSEMDKKPVKLLSENGALYINQPVVTDGIITANGPAAAEEFGKTLKKLLE